MSEAAIPAYMEPQWFFPLFAVMWLGISALLSHVGGWSSLAADFRAEQPAIGESFRFVSGSVGAKFLPVSYGRCLFVVVNNEGFHLSILFPFRFQTPPLFIPWIQVETVEEKRFLFVRYTAIRVRNQWPNISIRGRAGQCIREAYAVTHSKSAL